MGYLEENRELDRHVFLDLVRAVALFGIALVNVAYFAFPGEITYFHGGLDGPVDGAAAFAIDALFLFKSYTLFSIVFGVGLALQMASAERRGAAFGPRHFRRTLGLLLLGLLHVTIAFVGDILIVYALIGALLFLFRNLSARALLRWGAGFLCLQLLVAALFAGATTMGETFDPAGMAATSRRLGERMDAAATIYANGGFVEIAAQRWRDWTGYALFVVPLQGPGVLAFFLFGLAGVRSGTALDPAAALWRRARWPLLPVGLVVSLIGAWRIHVSADPLSGAGLTGTVLILLGAPFSSLGYLGLLAKWTTGPMTPAKRFLARAGTASLSAYLLQSLILSLVFCGYGLGLYGRVGAAGCVAIGAAAGAASLVALGLWRTRFARGPAEALLRRWTYLGGGR